MLSRRNGMHYEDLARQYLEARGLICLQRNYHCRFGEIDLIMREGETLCFIEVKFRRSLAFGGAAYAVPESKQRKLVKSALSYIAHEPAASRSGSRFDVLLVQGQANGADQINWIQNAFYAS